MKDFDEFLDMLCSEEYQVKMAQTLAGSCEIEQERIGRKLSDGEKFQTLSKAYTVKQPNYDTYQ